MTRPDIDALEALLDKATPGKATVEVRPTYMASLVQSMLLAAPALIAYVRELEQQILEGQMRASNAIASAAIAMRERCAQKCEKLSLRYDNAESEASSRVYADLCRGSRNGADACAAAIRALEP